MDYCGIRGGKRPGDVASLDFGDEFLELFESQTGECGAHHFLDTKSGVFECQFLKTPKPKRIDQIAKADITPPVRIIAIENGPSI